MGNGAGGVRLGLGGTSAAATPVPEAWVTAPRALARNQAKRNIPAWPGGPGCLSPPLRQSGRLPRRLGERDWPSRRAAPERHLCKGGPRLGRDGLSPRSAPATRLRGGGTTSSRPPPRGGLFWRAPGTSAGAFRRVLPSCGNLRRSALLYGSSRRILSGREKGGLKAPPKTPSPSVPVGCTARRGARSGLCAGIPDASALTQLIPSTVQAPFRARLSGPALALATLTHCFGPLASIYAERGGVWATTASTGFQGAPGSCPCAALLQGVYQLAQTSARVAHQHAEGQRWPQQRCGWRLHSR